MAESRKNFKIIISATDKASGPLKLTQQRIKKIGASMKRVGRSLTMGLSAPILAFGGFTIRAAAKFEQEMNKVKGLTKATADEFEQLNDLAKELGSTTQFSASEAAGAMEKMAKAGFSVENILTGLPPILELAAASSVELAEAGELASGMMKGFGIDVGGLSRMNDKLVTANISTLTSLSDIVETLAEIAPLSRNMGQDFGEVAAAAGFMGDALLKGGRGGVALRTIMLSLTSATPKANAVLNKLKIKKSSIINSKNQLTSLIAVVKQLEEAGADVQDVGDIFGRRGVTPMMALIEAGSVQLQALKDEINAEAAIGESGRQAAIRMAGAAGAMLEFKSAVEGLQIAIGETGLLKSFENLTRRFTSWLQAMSNAERATLKNWVIFAALVAIIGPLVVIIGVVATAIAGFTSGVWIAIAVITGLIALGSLLLTFWEPVADFFIGLGEILRTVFEAFDTGFAFIGGLLPDFLKFDQAQLDQFSSASFGGQGSPSFIGPLPADFAGKLAIKVESDTPVTVTKLESSGEVEIDVDSGPGMSGI